MSNTPSVVVKESPEACAQYLAEQLIAGIRACIEAKGICILALSGGSTPKLLYERLAELPAGTIDWPNVTLIWGDERNVDANDSNSNYRMVKLALLDHLGANNRPQVLRIPTGDLSPQEAADTYQKSLESLIDGGKGQLDIVLLGMGDDAHTASLFPETEGLKVKDRLVVANWVEKLDTWRVSLTYDAINSAAKVYFLVCGASKTDALKQIWYGPKDINLYPSQGIVLKTGELSWIVDEAAVKGLDLPVG